MLVATFLNFHCVLYLRLPVILCRLRSEELAILRENLPFAPDEILQYVTDFLQQAHAADETYTVRDGINIARYALKLRSETGQPHRLLLQAALRAILGEEATRYNIRR